MWWLILDALIDITQFILMVVPILTPIFKPIIGFLKWLGNEDPEVFQIEEGVMEPLEDPRFREQACYDSSDQSSKESF